MGNQHNTHVWNNTPYIVKVVLTDRDARNASQILKPDEVYNFPTPSGRGTASVFRRYEDGTFAPVSEGTITDDSDRSFIVEEVGGYLTFYRAKYGTIRVKETGMR